MRKKLQQNGSTKKGTNSKAVKSTADDFMSFASHELRNPLAVITLNLDMLTKYYADELKHPEVVKHLTSIRHASEEMHTVMEHLRQMAKKK